MESSISLVDAKTSSPSVGLDNTLYGFDMRSSLPKTLWPMVCCFNGIDGGANRNAAAMTPMAAGIIKLAYGKSGCKSYLPVL